MRHGHKDHIHEMWMSIREAMTGDKRRGLLTSVTNVSDSSTILLSTGSTGLALLLLCADAVDATFASGLMLI